MRHRIPVGRNPVVHFYRPNGVAFEERGNVLREVKHHLSVFRNNRVDVDGGEHAAVVIEPFVEIADAVFVHHLLNFGLVGGKSHIIVTYAEHGVFVGENVLIEIVPSFVVVISDDFAVVIVNLVRLGVGLSVQIEVRHVHKRIAGFNRSVGVFLRSYRIIVFSRYHSERSHGGVGYGARNGKSVIIVSRSGTVGSVSGVGIAVFGVGAEKDKVQSARRVAYDFRRPEGVYAPILGSIFDRKTVDRSAYLPVEQVVASPHHVRAVTAVAGDYHIIQVTVLFQPVFERAVLFDERFLAFSVLPLPFAVIVEILP